MIKKWTIVSFALLLTLSMLVSAGYAVEPTFRMKQYSGYKTFTAALYGQVRIDAVVEVTSGLAYVDQSKAKWNIGIFGYPGESISVWVWVPNGQMVDYPKNQGSAYAYYYAGKFYVTWATYRWAFSQYDRFEYYSIYFYYNGACKVDALWKFLVEI